MVAGNKTLMFCCPLVKQTQAWSEAEHTYGGTFGSHGGRSWFVRTQWLSSSLLLSDEEAHAQHD